MTNPTITVGEAVELINDSILTFEDGLDSQTISDIIYSINNELQVRDYVLGLPYTYPMETCKAFVSYISDSVDGADRYSVDTINSAYNYETEDMEMSLMLLATALDTKSDYPLANLIGRVINAGWPSGAFVEMRNELHPKVIDMVTEMYDTVI